MGHVENLKIAFDNLKSAIEQNPAISEEIIWDIDLLNLRFSGGFKEKFKELGQIGQKSALEFIN